MLWTDATSPSAASRVWQGRVIRLIKVLHRLALILLVAACSENEAPEESDVVRVGVLPDQASEQLTEIFTPLLDHLAAQMALNFELVVPESYGALVDLFAAGEVDLAFFGGVTFLQAEAMVGAEAIVMRDVDRTSGSVFVVRSDNPAAALEDIKGRPFAFGSKLSTSGHLMPRYFLIQSGIDPESHFSEVRYSGSHDATAYQVRDGEADVGALNRVIYDQLVSSGRLREGTLRVIYRTPSYVDYVWAVQKGMSGKRKIAIRDAFLELSAADPGQALVLSHLGAEYFIPTTPMDFKGLRQIAESRGLLDPKP